jgi:hypothetical protein
LSINPLQTFYPTTPPFHPTFAQFHPTFPLFYPTTPLFRPTQPYPSQNSPDLLYLRPLSNRFTAHRTPLQLPHRQFMAQMPQIVNGASIVNSFHQSAKYQDFVLLLDNRKFIYADNLWHKCHKLSME